MSCYLSKKYSIFIRSFLAYGLIIQPMKKIYLFLALITFGTPLATAQEVIATIDTDSCRVLSFAISPDGKLLAAGCFDKTTRIYEFPSGKFVKALEGHESGVNAVAFSYDSKYMASGSWDQTIKIWKVADWEMQKTLRGHTDKISTLSFSPVSYRLASGSDDKTIRMWDIQTGTTLNILQGHTDPILTVKFNPLGNLIASAGWDKVIRIWNTTTSAIQSTLPGHSSYVYALVWSKNGKTLLSAGLDNAVKTWDVTKVSLIQNFNRHSGGVTAADFSYDGSRIVSGSEDGTLRIWNVSNGMSLKTIEDINTTPIAMAFSPNGEFLVMAGENRKILFYDWSDFKYETCVKDKLDQFKHMLAPKDEFETSQQYEARISEYNNMKKGLKDKCRDEEKNFSTQASTKTAKSVSYKITDISGYNADRQEYMITVDGRSYAVSMPVDDARTFKENYKSVTVNGFSRFNPYQDTEELFNMKFSHPVSKKVYTFGLQASGE
jgi:WD40 repeat protein